VTVRQKVEQLISEPAVADLGYSADQRLVATALLGLQVLADEIDELKRRSTGPADQEAADQEAADQEAADQEAAEGRAADEEEGEFVTQLADLTAQVKKLKKAVKKCVKNQNKKKNKKKDKKKDS